MEFEAKTATITDYRTILVLLIVLTGVTIYTAKQDMGMMSIAVAMGIASLKAALVLLWFMHLKFEGLTNRVIFFSSVFFLIIFYALVAADIFAR